MKNKILTLFVCLIAVFMLSGCKQQKDSENTYKLPLGDVAYYTEFDFYLKNSSKVSDEATLATNYLESNQTYTFTLKADITNTCKAESKYIYLEAGYYEGEVFKALPSTNKQTEKLVKGTEKEIAYTFTTEDVTTYSDKNVLVKLHLGTLVDETELGKEEYKNVQKSLRGCSLTISKAELSYGENTKNLLVETDTLGTAHLIGAEATLISNYVHYYNTALVTHTNNTANPGSTLVITLNTKTGVWQWIVEMLGVALYWLIGVLGNKYWLGLLVFTIALRTAAWPIYAKSNSYSSNMAKIQPEMQRIQAKYQGRTDQNSQMKQQMEMRELMKKNKVSVFGCLTPFLQMPIFIAVYQVVSRFPLTPKYSTLLTGIDYMFLGTSFGTTYGVAEQSVWLAVVVGVTMIGSQLLTMLFQKMAQKKHENFYTKQQNNKQQNKTMIIFMIVMTVMMVFFALTNAGIAFYWIIGNLYQIGQTALSKYLQEKKEEKERREKGIVRGRQ